MTPATLRNNTDCMRETSGGGAWSTVTGETKSVQPQLRQPGG